MFIRTRTFWRALTLAAVLMTAAVAPGLQAQEQIAVRVALDKQHFQVGEPFILQIQVQGSDQVERPDTSAIRDFSVAYAGGNTSNRSFTNIINGQITREEFHGYLMNLRLTPLRTGAFTIPSLTVRVGGTAYRTQPVSVTVGAAEASGDFKITQTLPRTNVYLGETIPLKMTWYFRKDVNQIQEANLSLPAAQVAGVAVSAPPQPANLQDRGYVQVPLNGETAVAKLESATLDGTPCNTVNITRYLTPMKTGTITLPPATASCGAVVGYEKGGSSSPFSDMFGDDPFANNPFFSGRKPVVKRFYSTSDPLTLTVKELPAVGKPADFSGLVGRFTIAARVEPETASVGEPLTLTVMISGADCPERLKMPDLNAQPDLARDFRIQTEQTEGALHGEVMVYTRTLRAKSDKITEVPAIRLSYFNPSTEQYETAQSRPLPLRIEAAKTVTAADVEGGAPIAASAPTTLESAVSDIRHNYIDPSCLAPGCAQFGGLFADPAWIALLLIPPLAAGVLALLQLLRRQYSNDSERRKASGALRAFAKTVKRPGLDANDLLAALQEYFAARLFLPQAGLTGAEVHAQLTQRGIAAPTLENIGKIFAHCEAARYGGKSEQAVSAKFAAGILATLEQLEKELR